MYVSWQTIAPSDYYYFLTTDNTLDPHYNALRYNAVEVMVPDFLGLTKAGYWFHCKCKEAACSTKAY